MFLAKASPSTSQLDPIPLGLAKDIAQVTLSSLSYVTPFALFRIIPSSIQVSIIFLILKKKLDCISPASYHPIYLFSFEQNS